MKYLTKNSTKKLRDINNLSVFSLNRVYLINLTIIISYKKITFQ